MLGYLALLGFIMTIPAANWMVGNVGASCVPNGPCLIPVGFGLSAPSGVLMIGVALFLRDVLQARMGIKFVVGGIAIGTILSSILAPPALVAASATAFLLSEFADLCVYTPLQRNGFIRAVVASNVVGALVDSGIFLLLAFGSLEFFWGQFVGKVLMLAVALPAIWVLRRRSRLTPN